MRQESIAAERYVAADPYPWPYNGDLRPQNTALIVIDMQTDFCGVGGYVDKMGYDLSLTRAPIEPIKRTLAAMRAAGLPRHPHPRGPSPRPRRPAGQQALALAADRRRHRRSRARAAASWCAASRAGRSSPSSRRVDGEPIIDKPGKGSFCATDLELMLRQRGIDNIVLTGITTDVCVHTTMREANDRGFECLLLEDCCGATDQGNHDAAIKMIKMQGGVFGAVSELGEASSRRSRERDGDAHPPGDRRRRPPRTLEALDMTKRFGEFTALDDVSLKVAAGHVPCAAGRERRRQEHARQMHHGLLPGRRRRGHGRRPPAGHRQSARRARARPRHGLPALHAGAGA